MTRGVAHPSELRAAVIGAILAGATLSQAARQYGLSKGTVAEWLEDRTVRTDQRARDPETIGDLIYDLIAEHARTLHAQLQAAARADWLEKQPAAELAQLLVAERDTLIRLLAGLRPVDEQPALDGAASPAAPSPAADSR